MNVSGFLLNTASLLHGKSIIIIGYVYLIRIESYVSQGVWLIHGNILWLRDNEQVYVRECDRDSDQRV